MLATPEAADWAEHPAARAGKLEKRGRLGPFVAAKDPAALSQVSKSHLEIIVAVGENRQRHAAALAATDDPVERAVLEREHSDIINEAVDYRLAMLGLSDEALPENVRGVDRAALGDAYLVVYSSSTVWKSTNASGAILHEVISRR
jgi:hypothetical protein